MLRALCAQTTTSTVTGAVRQSGAPVANVAVTLRHDSTGVERKATTAANGEFLFTLLPPADYTLRIAAPHVTERRIHLLVNQEVHVDLAFAAPSVQTAEVTAVRGMLRPESAALGTTIDNRLVTGLPLDGRNFLDLSLLIPGAVPAAQGSAASARGDFAFSVNGAREDANNFLLDGVYNGDPKLNTFGVNAAVDAIREFEVLTSTYDASFGRNGGAQVNVIVKSGGNDVHGTAYEFFRNAALDGRNFFAPAGTDPRYQRNQFGASIGAPIRRNRTFLFGDFEGRRVREGITRVTNVPTALERTGDFSQSGLPFLIDLFTQQPFPGNRLPRERLHPIGGALASLYPLPNRDAPRQNFVSSPVLRDRNDQFDARLDHRLTGRDDLAVRFSFADRAYFEPFGAGNITAVPGFGNDVPRRAQNFMAAETHTFSPALLNEFRFAFTRVANEVLVQNRTGNLNNATFGLPAPSNSRDAGLTSISVPGYSSLGDETNNPQMGRTRTVQWLDTATWVRGRHLAKFGFDVRRLQQDAFRDVQSRGFISLVGFTGNALAEMLQGIVSASGRATLDNPQALRTTSTNLFVNDSWRLAPRVTLNLGLRYEFNSPAVDATDRANLYDPAQGRLVAVGQAGFPRAGYTADRNNFAPRAGLAVQVASKTLVRAGYGIYYDQSPLAPGEGLYFSAPYFDFRLFFFSAQAPLLLHNPFPANAAAPFPPSATAFQRDFRTGYMQHWNFDVQQQLGHASVFEAGYVGSRGTALLSARDLNQPGPSAAPFNLRPNPLFGDINIIESRANSNYHALQARFQQRFAHGLSALASYSWSKSIDDASGFFSSAGDPNFPQDSRFVNLERARSNFDVRHRLNLSYAYDLPFAKGNRVWGGWQTFGIWTFQTGRPFTVALHPDNDNSGTGRSSLGFGNNDRPHYLRNARRDSPTPERWFDTSAFAIPARGTFGNAGRNILDGPGLAQVNASLVKHFGIGEARSLQFRAEVFNLTNRVNFDLPDLTVESPSFGRIASAQNPRRVQLGLKFLF
ncbi:MAG: TonB-dependent receptor [Bryobacterales bacterium]|nr:TonB-dependent receptor [Bryobacterales bacterium]